MAAIVMELPELEAAEETELDVEGLERLGAQGELRSSFRNGLLRSLWG
jgi:hypothetical protein